LYYFCGLASVQVGCWVLGNSNLRLLLFRYIHNSHSFTTSIETFILISVTLWQGFWPSWYWSGSYKNSPSSKSSDTWFCLWVCWMFLHAELKTVFLWDATRQQIVEHVLDHMIIELNIFLITLLVKKTYSWLPNFLFVVEKNAFHLYLKTAIVSHC
jgi:hypothetical protein